MPLLLFSPSPLLLSCRSSRDPRPATRLLPLLLVSLSPRLLVCRLPYRSPCTRTPHSRTGTAGCTGTSPRSPTAPAARLNAGPACGTTSTALRPPPSPRHPVIKPAKVAQEVEELPPAIRPLPDPPEHLPDRPPVLQEPQDRQARRVELHRLVRHHDQQPVLPPHLKVPSDLPDVVVHPAKGTRIVLEGPRSPAVAPCLLFCSSAVSPCLLVSLSPCLPFLDPEP